MISKTFVPWWDESKTGPSPTCKICGCIMVRTTHDNPQSRAPGWVCLSCDHYNPDPEPMPDEQANQVPRGKGAETARELWEIERRQLQARIGELEARVLTLTAENGALLLSNANWEIQWNRSQRRTGELEAALQSIADGTAFRQDAEGNCVSDFQSTARKALSDMLAMCGEQ